MFEILRKSKRGIMGVLAVGFLAALLVPFGIGVSRNNLRGRKGAVVKVGSKEYSDAEYFHRLERIRNVFVGQLGAQYAAMQKLLNLEQRTIDDMVRESLLEEFSDRLQLTAGTSQIENKIKNHPFFGGHITRELYQDFLDRQGITGTMLEAMMRRELVNEQLDSVFGDISQPTDIELRAIYNDDNRKASFRYLTFTPSIFEPKVDVSDEAKLKSYFTDHSDKYRKPRAARFTHVAFRADDFANKVELSEDDVKAEYDREQRKFVEPKQIHLRRIIIKKKPGEGTPALEKLVLGNDAAKNPSPNDAANAEKKALAQKLYERAEGGDDFSKLAAENSEDETTKDKGGDMGWLTYDQLEPPVRNAIAKVDEKRASNVVEQKDGYAIFYVDEAKAQRQKELSEVRQEIQDALRRLDAPMYAQQRANELSESWQQKDQSLLDFAKENKLTAEDTAKPLVATELPGGVPSALVDKAISLPAQSKEMVDVGDTTYLLEVTQVVEASIPEFNEVKDAVVRDYRKEQAGTLAKTAAEQALKLVLDADAKKEGAVIAALESKAKEYGMKVETAPETSRASASGPLFTTSEIKRAAFSLSKESPVASRAYLAGGDYIVLTLENSMPPPDTEFAAKKNELATRETAQSGQRLMAALMETLKAKTDIWVDPHLVNTEG